MAVMRYEPWGVVSQLQNEINRVFGNLNDTEGTSATSEWSPAVDVREYSDRCCQPPLAAAIPRPDAGRLCSHPAVRQSAGPCQ